MLLDYRNIYARHTRIGDIYRGSAVDRIRVVGGRIVLQLVGGAESTLNANDLICVGRRA